MIRVNPRRARQVQSIGNIEPQKKYMKDTEVIQWVSTPTRQRLAISRKRTLRSRKASRDDCTVMAARSVWSEDQSLVIESRKDADRWGLPVRGMGGSTGLYAVRPWGRPRQAKCSEARPGSESRAKIYWDNLGTWESLNSPVKKTRKRTLPSEQRPGVLRNGCVESSQRITANDRKPLTSWKRGSGARVTGSLSSLIVALENRETLPGGSL